MITKSTYTEEDNMSVEERERILEEVTREKGRHASYAALKYDCAKRRGYSSWEEYQKVLRKKREERREEGRIMVRRRRSEKRKERNVRQRKELRHAEKEDKLEKYLACGMF